MRTVLRTVEWVLDKVLIVLFAAMVFAIAWQVFARYILEAPTAWSEELARFHMVAVTMLGSALVVARQGHVDVTVFVELLPTAVQRVLAVVRDLLIVAMGGFLAWAGWGLVESGGRRVSSGLGVSMAIPYSAVAIGSALIAILVILRHFRASREDDRNRLDEDAA
ncbi:TRAP transporter small permease [Acuticoccus sp.]|uniref:TRAP transporter small permease n=1 Tax=Acuticoccus sp. TaxID=1904378 RepID=UPI003B530212